jgi:L-amino acid N-acyltransferase YncA
MRTQLSQAIKIIPMLQEHWSEVSLIYKQGIATGHATFETICPDWSAWDTAHRKDCRLVAIVNGSVSGWAALSPVSGRCVYSGVAEVSVYIHQEFRGMGIGNGLLEALICDSEKQGIWTLQAGIYPENEASLCIHRNNGFREVGKRERIGKMGEVWRDVLLMERRSARIGI